MSIRMTLFIILVFLSGCATPQISLMKQTTESIESADSVIFIPQNNLNVTVPATNPGSAGLIGALIIAGIDSVRRSNAEKEAAPIIQQLQNYDFRTIMLNTFSAEIPKIATVKFNTPVHLETIYSESQKRISFDQSNASAVMFATVGYRLESGNIIITSHLELYPKSESLLKFRNKANDSNPTDYGNVIYRKAFIFTKQGITTDNVRDSLTEGASSIAKQISEDLNHPL